MFSGSITVSRSLFTNTDTTASNNATNTYLTDLLNSYQILFTSHVYLTILDLNNHFINGDIQYLLDNLTQEDFNQLSLEFLDVFFPNEPEYEKTRQILIRLLQNLRESVRQAQTLSTLQDQLKRSQERDGILDNIDAIKKYLEILRKQNMMYKTTIQTVAAKLKPEYSMYISKYGIPVNGNFDPILMADILSNL